MAAQSGDAQRSADFGAVPPDISDLDSELSKGLEQLMKELADGASCHSALPGSKQALELPTQGIGHKALDRSLRLELSVLNHERLARSCRLDLSSIAVDVSQQSQAARPESQFADTLRALSESQAVLRDANGANAEAASASEGPLGDALLSGYGFCKFLAA